MSLQVWLPLNGDLHNQGLYNNILNSTVVFNNNGKIGKCLESTTQLDLHIPQSIYDIYTVANTEISYCLWVKIDKTYLNNLISTTDFSTKTQIYNKIMGFNSGTTSNGLGIQLRTDTGLTQSTVLNTIKLYGWLRSGTANDGSSVVDINLDQWYHICITYNQFNLFRFYINGALITEKTIARGALNTSIADKKVVLNSQTAPLTTTSAATVHLLNLKEYINDVRIYDHCLSPKEVEEIAKGLVLHYKLDDRYAESTTNLLSVANSYSDPNALFPMQHSTDTSYGYYFGSYNVSNNKYTFSGYINNTSNESLALRLRGKKVGETGWTVISTSTYVSPGEYKYIKVSVDISNSSTWQAILNPCIFGNKQRTEVTANPYIYYLQLEEKDHATPWVLGGTSRTPTTIYDASGYSHNGTISGSLTAAAGSPRYDVATVFDGSSYITDIPLINQQEELINELSYSFWIYRTDTDTSGWHTIYRGPIDIYIHSDGQTLRFQWYPTDINKSYTTQNTWAPGYVIPLNTWTHIGMIWDNGFLRYYVNGVFQEQSNRLGSTSDHFYIKGNNSIPNRIGYHGLPAHLSDLRAYATALTDDQVKELYNTSMSIDSNGNIHTRELVEL